MLPNLYARGDRVEVATIAERDVEPYRVAVKASAERLSAWNPVDPEDLPRHLRAQSSGHRTFLIRALDPEGGHGIVGKVNVTNVVRGRFQNGTIGYDSYDPYAGKGLFAEGLSLTVGLAFAADPRGMGLHRVEANVQPGNTTSAGVLRRLGFRREGHIRDMLWLEDGEGHTAWRDHDAYAVTAGEWPARQFGPHRPARTVVLVNGIAGAGKTTLAGQLSRELSVPLYAKDVVKETLWDLLGDSPVGGVVDSWFEPTAHPYVLSGLERAGLEPERVLQVWCGGPAVDDMRPLALLHTITVDTSQPVSERDVAALALRARAVS